MSKKELILLLIIDSHDWAFGNISKNIKFYSDNFDFKVEIITYPSLYKNIKKDDLNNNYKYVDHVLFFWYGGINVEILNYYDLNRHNFGIQTINLCIYDYSKWINNSNANEMKRLKNDITYFFCKIDNYLCSCEKIKFFVEKNLDILNKKSFLISDGVNTDKFKYVGYDIDIYTKPVLTIGWIGNSNPAVHGINKGFLEIKRCIESEYLKDKFIFTPLDIFTGTKMSHDNVPNYIANIDIIVCFSMYEGTPNQILEASSSGKCWISTNVGIVENLQNTNNESACGIIVNRTIEDLTNALLYLYDNRELIVKYGKNGNLAIEKNWSWKLKTKNLYEFFNSFPKIV